MLSVVPNYCIFHRLIRWNGLKSAEYSLKKDWAKVSKGLLQRVKALNLFIDDVYNDRKIFKDNIIPEDLVFNSPFYLRECYGFSPKYKAWSNISGIDLINEDYVLKANTSIYHKSIFHWTLTLFILLGAFITLYIIASKVPDPMKISK